MFWSPLKFLNKTRVPRMNNEIPSGKTPYLKVRKKISFITVGNFEDG